jgi:predicted dehydrogenase
MDGVAIRFGVIGTAYWAREVHLPGLLGAGADVVGIWGRSHETAETIARASDVRAFADLDEMLAACDAVTIAVSPDAQAEFALRAAQAGKHLIAEKPLTRDSESARRIGRAVKERDLAALVFFIRRFVPEIAAAIAVEQGHPWTRAGIRVHSAAMATPSPYANSVWRKAPGAALWDIGPHILSVLVPMMGRVTTIEAQPERDGVTVFRTWHERGGVADVSVTLRSAAEATSNDYRFMSATRDIVLPDPAFSRVDAFSNAVRQLSEAVQNGRRLLPCGLELGIDVVDWLAKAEADQFASAVSSDT